MVNNNMNTLNQCKNVIFYAFSYKLKQFLESNGLTPIVDNDSKDDGTCSNLRTGRDFWRYVKNQELDNAMDEWRLLYY